LTIVTLRHIENDSVSVKLWRSIAIYRTRGVVLEGSGKKLPVVSGA
jgi:hypothetical protein